MQQIGGRPWHLQIHSRLSVIPPLKAQLAALPVPAVFDHFAGAQAALGPQQPGFDAVLDLVGRARPMSKSPAPPRLGLCAGLPRRGGAGAAHR